MPGLALLKDSACRRNEERIIREWRRVTGNKVLNWHYSCWPAERTSAPYVFGRTIQAHYEDMQEEVCGSYVCGSEDDPRLALSTYVWMRCLWNPDVDVDAIYDEFARRMFASGALPMRELIDLQERCWSRTWADSELSYRNIFEVSYPHADVKRMIHLLREAQCLTERANDEISQKRIAWYVSGFSPFLLESAALARRTERKSVALGTACEMIVARSVMQPTPWAKTTVETFRETAGETNFLRVCVRCSDPAANKMDFSRRDHDFIWGDDCVTFVFGDETVTRSATVYLTGEIEKTGTWANDEFSATVLDSHLSLFSWSVDARIQLSREDVNRGKIFGNICRWRVGDRRKPEKERVSGSRYEQSRLETCYTFSDEDPAAFVEFCLQ